MHQQGVDLQALHPLIRALHRLFIQQPGWMAQAFHGGPRLVMPRSQPAHFRRLKSLENSSCKAFHQLKKFLVVNRVGRVDLQNSKSACSNANT